MDNRELIQRLNRELQTGLPQSISSNDLVQKLSEFINHLIQTDFQKLVSILYRADVSETKLKLLLGQNSGRDAAPVIAKLIIEREQQKINSKSQFTGNESISDEEKW